MQRLARTLSYGLAAVSGAALIAVMALMFVDVIGRYLFNNPLTAAVELIELLMGLALCFGFALTALRRGHIRVDLVTQLAPRPVQRLLDWVSDATTLAFFVVVCWKLFQKAGQTFSDGIFTQIVGMPVFPVVYLMSLAAAAAVVTCAVLLLKPSAGGPSA
ncbi:TRAP transporter small permease [Sagittula sp. S175]|uniref:TRAP transporter small permease n=1 Tax=Sagittula sp. S175 TaxID=3415129 RepID=UPI003C79EF98